MANSDKRKKGKCEELAVELSIDWIEEAVNPEICYKPKENKHSVELPLSLHQLRVVYCRCLAHNLSSVLNSHL